MSIIPIRSREEWRVLYMKRLVGVCRTCQWNEERMVDPRNRADIEEVKRQMRVAHAAQTKCPAEIRIL